MSELRQGWSPSLTFVGYNIMYMLTFANPLFSPVLRKSIHLKTS